jgi:hypothetical protein
VSKDHLSFLHDLEHISSEPLQPRPQSEWIDLLSESENVQRRSRATIIRQAASVSAGIRDSADDNGVKIWSGPSADKEKASLRIHTPSDSSPMEKDFTTSGVPSKLGCPFAPTSERQSPLITPRSSTSRMSLRGSLRGRRSKRPSFNDPIRAEICGNDLASASASVDGSAAVCPIRFLDQHAPEDVAKYFEKHKHELPRSHEVCINRFQSNTESIEQLDRKYGNLVSMIQGLGEKHQAWLPEEPDENAEDPEHEVKADEKVQNWATAVSNSLQDHIPAEEVEPGLDDRTAHFDRPFKEIRVGESPSRPWGIQIPAKYTNGDSSSSVGSAPTASPPPIQTAHSMGEAPEKAGKCPFDHRAMGRGSDVKGLHDSGQPAPQTKTQPPRPLSPKPQESPEPQEVPDAGSNKKIDPDLPKAVPQMVFNGPVFIGYPPDQLMALVQNSNLGASMR